jgi:hypothetical protein
MLKEKHLASSTLPEDVVGVINIANQIGLLEANNMLVFIGFCHLISKGPW